MNITSKYSKINYEENDEILAKELSKYLDNHAEEIYDFFDPTLERNIININIMTKEKYDEYIKKHIMEKYQSGVLVFIMENVLIMYH